MKPIKRPVPSYSMGLKETRLEELKLALTTLATSVEEFHKQAREFSQSVNQNVSEQLGNENKKEASLKRERMEEVEKDKGEAFKKVINDILEEE